MRPSATKASSSRFSPPAPMTGLRPARNGVRGGRRDPDQLLFLSRSTGDDYFLQTRADKDFYTTHLDGCWSDPAGRRPLPAHGPYWPRVDPRGSAHCSRGADRLHAARVPADLPRDGQMVRTSDFELCTHASPRRCHECFPECRAGAVLLARALHQGAARARRPLHLPQPLPARALRGMGVAAREAGRDRLRPPPGCRAPPRQPLRPGERRSSFGFFGQLNPYKGVDVLLDAMARPASEPGPR